MPVYGQTRELVQASTQAAGIAESHKRHASQTQQVGPYTKGHPQKVARRQRAQDGRPRRHKRVSYRPSPSKHSAAQHCNRSKRQHASKHAGSSAHRTARAAYRAAAARAGRPPTPWGRRGCCTASRRRTCRASAGSALPAVQLRFRKKVEPSSPQTILAAYDNLRGQASTHLCAMIWSQSHIDNDCKTVAHTVPVSL